MECHISLPPVSKAHLGGGPTCSLFCTSLVLYHFASVSCAPILLLSVALSPERELDGDGRGSSSSGQPGRWANMRSALHHFASVSCTPILLLLVTTSPERELDGDSHSQSSGSPWVWVLFFESLVNMSILVMLYCCIKCTEKLLVQLLSQALIYGHVSICWVDVNSNETWTLLNIRHWQWTCTTYCNPFGLVSAIPVLLHDSYAHVVCLLFVTFVMLHLCTCISPNRSPSHWWITLRGYSQSATWACGPGPDSLQED